MFQIFGDLDIFKHEFHLYSPIWLLKDRDFMSKNKIAQKTCAGEAFLKVVMAKLCALKRHRAQECDFMQTKVRLRWGSIDGMILRMYIRQIVKNIVLEINTLFQTFSFQVYIYSGWMR